MSKFMAILIALIASLGIYPTTGTVTEVDRAADTVTFTTVNGHRYSFCGCEDWASNDMVSAILWDGGTQDVRDDRILCVRYAGFSEWLPDAFPHRMDFDVDFRCDFPEDDYDLYGQAELTSNILTSRKDRESYVVEVLTGVVIDGANGKLDHGAPYDYISYAGLGFEAGNRVVTYCVYALHSDGEDDVIARYDYLIQ